MIISITKILNRLRYQREFKGYTQENVADSLNISQKSYSNIENGKCSLNLTTFLEIVKFLEVDINLIISEKDIDLKKQVHCDICTHPVKIQELEKIIKIHESNIAFLQFLLKKSDS